MSRPIKLTDEYVNKAVEEFRESLMKSKLENGTLSYTKKFKYEGKEKAVIRYTQRAFLKMNALISSFESEIAWHGIGERTGENEFMINDIVVYPQKVSGAYVDMDEEAYNKWIIEHIEDEWIDNMVLQGHSHVRMSTSPSGTDLSSQGTFLSKLRPDGFYIFLIANKQGDANHKIYDLKNNTLYEKEDIEVVIEDQESIDAFVKEAKEIAKPQTHPVSKNVSNKSTATKSSTPSENIALKEKPKNKSNVSSLSDYDDDYYINGHYYNGYRGYYD